MGMLRGRVRVVLGSVALLLSFVAPAHAQQLFFTPPLTYGGSGPAVTADLRGNGKFDIVSGDGTVALSNGDGTFTYPAPIFSLGGSAPGPIAIADFNGDGKPDVLSGLNVYLGNGDGTFQAPRTISTGASVAGVAVADVNGDRKPDILVLLSGGGVLVFLGKGDGTFTTTNVVYPSSSGQLFAVGDFNGDGKADAVVVVINAGSGGAQGSVQVLLGNGDGTFQPGISTAGEVGSQAVVPEDVNGDGKLDLVMSGPGQTIIFLGNGDGTFHTPGPPLPAGGLLAIADVNGDGRPDVIVSNTFTQVFLGNGDGTFSLKGSVLGSIPVSQLSATSMVVADFNGDGKPDLAVANAILLGNGDGTFRGGSPVLSLAALGALDSQRAGGSGIVGGDFNGDGSPDLAVPAGNNLYIVLNDGTGAFLVAHTYPIGTTIGSLAVADLNNDGKLDLLLTVADANTAGVLDLDVMLGNGDGTFAAPTMVIQNLPGQINTAAIADFNDHNTPHIPDLVFGTTQGLEIFLGKGDGTFASPVVYFVPGGGGSDTADFNNDGIPDICAGDSALLGKGDGTFQPPIPNANCGGLAYGDFTGNGKLDTAYSSFDQPLGGPVFALYVSLGKGDGTFTTTQQAVLVPKFTSFPFIVDINSDGKADLVEGNGLNILLGNGDGTFGNPIAVLGGCPMCSGPNPVLIADVNGDHRPDAVLALNNGFEAALITLINVAGPLAPDFLLSASALSPQTVAAGGAATTTVTLAPANGFNGNVALSCVGLPAGGTCSFAPASISGGAGSSKLTITISAATAANTYFVSIVGTSASFNHSRLMTLIVTATPDFSMTTSTATSTVMPGQTATYMVSFAAAGGFSGNVTLSCSGAPASTTCSVSPAMVSIAGTAAPTATVTVTTTAASRVLLPGGTRALRRMNIPPTLLIASLVSILMIAILYRLHRERTFRWAPVVALSFVICVGLTLTSCGGGSSSGGGGGGVAGTPAGTYTITVSASATASSTMLTHTTKLTLIVQ